MATMTNKNGLPQPLVDAIKHDTYKLSGTISCSSLIDAPQIRVLKKAYASELESDVSEYLWALMGTAVHHILERAHISDIRKRAFLTVIETLQEKCKTASQDKFTWFKDTVDNLKKLMFELFPEVEGRFLWETQLHYEHKDQLLSGTFDLYDKVEKTLFDYKVCSVYAYLYPESRKKWSAQTNVYAFMLRNEGYQVDNINIVAIFRDWSASKALVNQDYPKTQFLTLPIAVQPQEAMKRYVDQRLDLHTKAENGEVPECNGGERWSSANEYAVIKKGMKRAVRKFDREDMAIAFVEQNKHKYETALEVFTRPGESKRCANYCPVRDFCPQKKREDESNLN